MESQKHKDLKKIGLNFLKIKVTDLVANEVKFNNLKSIADVCGINIKRQEIRIIEVKVSKQDFLRDKKLMDIEKSYYKHCHYFYIMCPENIIDINDIPKEYGLLWIDAYDNVIVKQNPKKNIGRLKTLFKTTLKYACRAVTNNLLFSEENRTNKDDTGNIFAKNAKIKLVSIKCYNCKHSFKELINEKSNELQCPHCNSLLKINNCKLRKITGFNKTFIKKINFLNI